MQNKFKYLLTDEAINKFYIEKNKYKWIRTEILGTAADVSKQYDDEQSHFDELQQELRKALTDESKSLLIAAQEHIFFLKLRIERLELWLSRVTAMPVLLSAISMLILIWKPHAMIFLVSFVGWVLSVHIAVRKFEIQKRKHWYKYLLVHLDAMQINNP